MFTINLQVASASFILIHSIIKKIKNKKKAKEDGGKQI